MQSNTTKIWLNILFGLLCLINCTLADEHYKDGQEVILWVNKVGPFRNPQETYKYYTLPFCKPEKEVETKMEGLGEALQGYELRKSAMPIHFNRDVMETSICSKRLTEDEAKVFKHAVRNQYWYQMFLDDLPIWGMVGVVKPGQTPSIGNSKLNSKIKPNKPGKLDEYYVYTHKSFIIMRNGNQIIGANLTYERPVLVEAGATLDFTYKVNWYETDEPYLHRFDKYLDYNFFEHQIHWFSVFNSFMMVIFLTGLVAMILMRTLKKDYARYAQYEDIEDDHDVGEESGWKQVHGDVFRAPSHLVIFSSLVGTGHQLAVLVFLIVFFAAVGTQLHLWEIYANRGNIVTIFIVFYALTSFVGGYGGGGYYARNDGKHWIQVMVLTASLFPGTCFLIAFLLNFIAIGYGSLASIPFGTMIALSFIWAFVSFPLTLVGTVIGRNWNGKADNPCRINPVPRHIPEKKWYLNPLVNIALGGILPFGSIFIEMYFVFTSFWHYKYYYVYGFMLLVFIILVVVSVCVTIVSTYFLLNSEDYRWQWVSFLSSSSTAAYVFLYSIYYFFAKTNMSGFLQTCFYFGYTFMFCFGLGITCGAVGFIGTSIFVKRIYQHVKID